MNFKKMILPLLITPLLAVSCNKSNGSKTPGWSKSVKKGMQDEFGLVLPYVSGLEDPYISFEDGELFVYAEINDYDSGLDFVQNYGDSLSKAEFVGRYSEIEEEEEGETYYSIYAEYYHATGFTFTAFEETFAKPIDLQIQVGESYSGYVVMLTALLEIQYKQSENPFSYISNVLGPDVSSYMIVEGSSYLYRYLPGYYPEEYYFDLVVQDSDCILESLVQDLVDEHFYIEEGGFFDSYEYWCLPWEEEYEFYINQVVEKENNKFDLYLTYGPYEKATIYDSFPMDELVSMLSYSGDSSLIPTYSAYSGYKIWTNNQTDFVYVDAIDPKAEDESIEKELSELFVESLTAKGYQPVADEEDDEEILYYQLTVEGVGVLTAGYQEDNYYFTGFFGFTPSN